jgi:hypothetical protein
MTERILQGLKAARVPQAAILVKSRDTRLSLVTGGLSSMTAS